MQHPEPPCLDLRQESAVAAEPDIECRYAYMKIKKLLDMQGATMNDVVRIMTYTTDVRFFQDALKCRAEAFGSAPIPASTFLVVSQLAWPNMAIEVDVTAMLAR
jgi:2-iminobutanoate/2-iminopropanoate deaminase